MPSFRTGTDDFKKLRDQGGYFVDKSPLIRSVLDSSEVTLIPRPRRFGKTLHMTMLRYFFEKSAEDRRPLFDGLAITDDTDAMGHQGQYPVIYLSLKDIKGASWEVAQDKLLERLSALHKRHDFLLDTLATDDRESYEKVIARCGSIADNELSLKKLIAHLQAYHNQPVVVLIDEYDSPVIEAWRNGYYDEMIAFMRSWLGGGLKHEEGGALFRGVVTGILRVARESIFSGLNNLDVASLLSSGPFANKFGFTEPELAQVLTDFDAEDLAGPMREWYNGYQFGPHTIYNPWSVICAISKRPDPIGPHWLNTASNDLIYAELESGGLPLKRELEQLLAGEELRRELHEHTIFSDVGKSAEHIWSFLVFSGYLKATDPQPDPRRPTRQRYHLSIPNLEVSIAFEQFVEHWHRSLSFTATEQLLDVLLDSNWPRLQDLLSELAARLLSCHDVAKLPEAVFHAFVLGLLAHLRQIYEIRSNVESGYGRADILMRPKTVAYPLAFIIEFKAIKGDADSAIATTEALAQIESRDYEASLLEAGVSPEHIRKLAIVVAGKHVTVTQG